MKTTRLAILSFVLVCGTAAYADTFGSGSNTFAIDFVTIGNPGNPGTTTGNPYSAGSVDYAYRMGKFEISEDMIDKANAEVGLGITKQIRGPNKPATKVNWFEAAQFVNWLNDQKGASPAYKFNGNTFELWQSGDAGYNPANPFRNSQAFYFLPSVDEWYKAAYYDPTAGVYYDYPTGSDTAPTGVPSGTAAGTAVHSQSGPADITLAGGLSPYGTMGQAGNVSEWQETNHDLVNDSIASDRGVRGGWWGSGSFDTSVFLSATARELSNPTVESTRTGFRVASIPEPTTSALALAALCLAIGRRSR